MASSPKLTERLPWVHRTLSVQLDDGNTVSVRVRSLGGLSVGPMPGRPGTWSVTANSTGHAVAALSSEEEAVKACVMLHRNCAAAFRERTVEAIRAKLPGWVKGWVHACREAGRCVDPF